VEYRYPHFQRELINEDASFTEAGRPGSVMPAFDLPTVDGGRVERNDYIHQRPLLLTFASIT